MIAFAFGYDVDAVEFAAGRFFFDDDDDGVFVCVAGAVVILNVGQVDFHFGPQGGCDDHEGDEEYEREIQQGCQVDLIE